MKKKAIISSSAAVLAAAICGANAQTTLTEVGVNIDGSGSTHDFLNPASTPTAPGTDFSGFSITSGLGSITATMTGVGMHQFITFVDDEADLSTGFINDLGSVHGSKSGNQSWQIDEPGYGNHGYFGTIGHNAFSSTVGSELLDNVNHLPSTPGDDVAVALGYDFNLTAGQKATLDFLASSTPPSSGFYLEQTAPSGKNVFFSSTLDITGGNGGGGNPGVPDAGTTFSALALALAGLAGYNYKFARK